MLRAALLAAVAVLAGSAPRILLAAGALPGWLRPFVWTDVLYIWERGLSGGRLPYWDVFFEYPPATGYIAALLSRATDGALPYVIAWALIQAAAAAAIACLLARECGAARTVRYWSLTPQLALLGSLNFDLLAVLALVAAVVLARRARVLPAAAALALGTAAKLFPAFALPVLLVRAGRGRIAAGVAFALVVAALYLPSAFTDFSPLGGIGRYAGGVGANLDSPWGLLHALLDGVGLEAGAIVLAVSLAGLAITYAFGVLPRARANDVAVPFALAVLALLMWSRLYSPQFSLWVLPFFALLPIHTRAFGLLTAADIAVFLTIFPLTLVRRAEGDVTPLLLLGVLATAVVARHLALILAWRELRARSEGAGAAV